MNTRVKMGISLVAVGCFLIVSSAIFQIQFTNVFETIVSDNLVLRPESQKILTYFRHPPTETFKLIYFFNVTNKDNVTETHPTFHKVGPYAYEEKREKYDLHFDEDAGTVTFLENKTHFFVPQMSGDGLTESDLITTINVVMMSVAASNDNVPEKIKPLIDLHITGEKPFITKTVAELLFAGYDDHFLKEIGGLIGDSKFLEGKFGFFYHDRNHTDYRYHTIKSGVRGMKDYQDTIECGEFQNNIVNTTCGTFGDQFAPLVSRRKEKPLRLYWAQQCHSVWVEFREEVSRGPLTLYRYFVPNLDEAYCPCRCEGAFGSNFFFTPHSFIHPIHITRVVSKTFLDIEPITGFTVRATKHLQVYFPFKKWNINGSSTFPNVSDSYKLPVILVNETKEMPVENVADLYHTLTLPFIIVHVGVGNLIVLGIALIVVGVRTCFRGYFWELK